MSIKINSILLNYMKILYAAQISNNTIVDGNPKFLFETDACYNLCVGITNTLIEQNPDYEIIVLLPHENLGIDVPNHTDKFNNHPNIKIITFNSPVGPGNTRYHFDYLKWVELANLHFKDVDVMINDQNTLTKNWNMLFHELGLNIPIVSTNYFMDSPLSKKVPEKIRYYERQMESFINSDLTAHQSQANKAESMSAFKVLFNENIATEIEQKTTIWRTGVQAKEILPFNTDERFDNITLYFGNRISDTANRYNNYHIFAQAIGILQQKYSKILNNVDFYFLNPTRKITDTQYSDIMEWSRGKATIMKNDETWNRQMYMEFINKAHISVNLFTNEVHGGVTHAEGMLSNNIVIVPNVNNYKWKYDQLDKPYPFLVNPIKEGDYTTISAEELANVLYIAITTTQSSKEKYDEYCILNHDLAYKYESYENAAVQINTDLKMLANVATEIKI